MVADHEDLSAGDIVVSPSQALGLQPGAGDAMAGQDALPAASEPAEPGRRSGRAAVAVLEEEGISDAELVGHLRKSGFDTPLGDRTFRALLDYENAVFLSWMSSGLIWEKIATLTRQQTGRAFRGRSNWTPDEADELRRETVTLGLLSFEASVLDGWHPDGGASVKTYFTTKCLWIFLNEYKKFARGKNSPVDLMGEILTPRHEPDPQNLAVDRDTARRAMARLPPEMQMILQYRAESYTNREIAELIGISEKAVEGRLRRYYDGRSWEDFGDE